jgi:hypothetical protein
MRPTIVRGAKVVVAFGETEVSFGDIVVFLQNGTLTVHRLVGAAGRGADMVFRTKGDCTLRFDRNRLRKRDIIGKAVAVVDGPRTVSLESFPARAAGKVLAAVSYVIGSAASLLERHG